MSDVQKRKKLRSIFGLIVEHYKVLAEHRSEMSVMERYQRMATENSHVQYNPLIVKATESDFLCDVEITAKRELSPRQYKHFKEIYLNENWEARRVLFSSLSKIDYQEYNINIQEVLGQAFKQVGLHPIKSYFKPTPIIRRKP